MFSLWRKHMLLLAVLVLTAWHFTAYPMDFELETFSEQAPTPSEQSEQAENQIKRYIEAEQPIIDLIPCAQSDEDVRIIEDFFKQNRQMITFWRDYELVRLAMQNTYIFDQLITFMVNYLEHEVTAYDEKFLGEAVRSENLTAIKWLLSQGVNPNTLWSHRNNDVQNIKNPDVLKLLQPHGYYASSGLATDKDKQDEKPNPTTEEKVKKFFKNIFS